jgi:hypothetical protein
VSVCAFVKRPLSLLWNNFAEGVREQGAEEDVSA